MRALAQLKRFLRGEEGVASVEFSLIFPVFLVLTVTGVEMGVLILRQIMLERGVDITVRELRIGSLLNPSFETVRNEICRNAGIIPDCANTLHIELTQISTETWATPQAAAGCVDRTGKVDPVVNFTPGQRNGYMLLRACSVFDPMFPTFGLGPNLPLDESGGYRIVAASAFVNEP